ncbi:uncharacterized protein [Arachis hypogaea]|uniref:uncharacterized protein n=1 Tax=Arachis hypogaea TaxID=3818 RepID=UPI003B223051
MATGFSSYTTATRSGILPPSVALKVRHPSSSFPPAPNLQPLFAVTDRGCFLELGVRRLCLLSRASVAVCLPFTFASSFAFARRSPFAFTRCSPFEFAFVRKPRCSASNSATNPRAPLSRRTALFCPRQTTTYFSERSPLRSIVAVSVRDHGVSKFAAIFRANKTA